jgi:RNA polymerase sigma-70 factor (ECF subfamily)
MTAVPIPPLAPASLAFSPGLHAPPVPGGAAMDAALTAELARLRPALVGHCYRMLGSVVDAEDAVQDALLRAWRAFDGFEARASLKTWLTAIATRVCLDRLATARRRRLRPVDLPDAPVPAEAIGGDLALVRRPHEDWVEPIPDALALPAPDACDPAERAVLRESVRLAFVAALQYLPPRQRAVLLLTQVLNWSAAEAAAACGMTVPAVNSALQRARATLQARNPAVVPRALGPAEDALLARYVAAFEAYDVAALTALLHEEATMSMPPYALWLRGTAAIARWLVTVGCGCEGSRLVPVAACGGTAFAQYRRGGEEAWGLILLGTADDAAGGARITSTTTFLDVATLFPRFGLPMSLPR